MNKPNCYECKWRESIPYNAHSCCVHPSINEADKIIAGLALMAGIISPAMKRMNISGNERSIERGWFFWPENFDPIWLESCNGFESKESENDENTKQRSE